jgi:hypothetical protein
MSILRPTRRRLVCAVLVLAALGGLWLAFGARTRFTEANFWRIHRGMTIDEVIAVLGPPTFDTEILGGDPPTRVCIWRRFGATGQVRFDRNYVVIYTIYSHIDLAEWLRWWWHRNVSPNWP